MSMPVQQLREWRVVGPEGTGALWASLDDAKACVERRVRLYGEDRERMSIQVREVSAWRDVPSASAEDDA
jgi:hypothetical protein